MKTLMDKNGYSVTWMLLMDKLCFYVNNIKILFTKWNKCNTIASCSAINLMLVFQ